MPNLKKQKPLVLISLIASVLIGCASSTPPMLKEKTNYQKIFRFPYESVWRAAQLTLRYPISINNMDTGVLETEWVKQMDGFRPPAQTGPMSSGVRFRIRLLVVQGEINGNPSVKVTAIKSQERLRDFFSEPENLKSDGLEEQLIFYRIERELIIDEALKKAKNTPSE